MAARPTSTVSTSGAGMILRRALGNALASEIDCESQLRAFAVKGDDEDVQSGFAVHAAETSQQAARLRERYTSLFGDTEPLDGSASLLHLTSPHLAHTLATSTVVIAEELTLQNLLIAYTAETGEIAMYETLAALAIAAEDSETELLARTLQTEERIAADKIWHFLPTRAKLAFNMLTISEVDPSVETKMADDRIV